MIEMVFERDIDKKYDKMTLEEKGQLIDSINDVLMNDWCPSYLNENMSDEDFRKFLNEYVRTDDEVFEEDIEHFEIRCPIEFLDKKAMIDMDEDYEDLIDGLHLNTFVLYEDDYDELVQNKILIEFKKSDKEKDSI